jgi:TolB-like protein/Flp pilus assembly protein TadD
LSLIAELKRRNVFKAGAAYLALGWVVIQVTATMVPALNLPPSVVPIATWIGVIGFPFVVLFAWAYELTPDGIKREKDIDRSTSITHVTGRRLDYLIVGLLVLAIALFSFDRFFPRNAAPGPDAGRTAPVAASATAPQPAATTADENSIAVLPFVDMSQARDQEYFSDGLSEELLNLLAQVPQLRVIARTSSFAFKGKEVGVAEIARALNVAHVLEGSVRKSGDTLRITAQLIRTADSSHLWSETFDRRLTDVFKVQDEIAAAVVAQLKIKLLPAQQVANARRTANAEAYSQYLLGNQHLNRSSEDSFPLAVAAFGKAIALDPDYAPAYAGLSYAEGYGAEFAASPEAKLAAQGRAQAAAEKAIALAPNLADGYAVRGWLRASRMWDWEGARADYERALALEPGSSLAHRRLGMLYQSLGQFPESIAQTRKAIELDPLSASNWTTLASAYCMDPEQYRDARQTLERALALNPDSEFVLSTVAILDLLEGRVQESLEVSRKAGGVWRLIGVAMAEHTLGHARESQQALDALIAKYALAAAYQIADVYAWRGEPDKAFEWLDRAYELHDGGLTTIKVDPALKSLYPDPRFAVMLNKLGLPP